jgi:DNA-binding CsgD family transcriptional regulator
MGGALFSYHDAAPRAGIAFAQAEGGGVVRRRLPRGAHRMKTDSQRRDKMRVARFSVAGTELVVYREPIAASEGAEHGLSSAEEEVIALLLEGLSLEEVAQRRATRLDDVIHHLDAACRKLGIETEPNGGGAHDEDPFAYGVAS